ncbi:MAG: NOP5/NOP56 family protein [Thermoplasmata archaeon]
MEKEVLVTTWFGSFLIKDGEILYERLFPKSPEEIAKRRSLVKGGEILDEERELAAEITEDLAVISERLSSLGEVISSCGPVPSPKERGYDMELLQKSLRIQGKAEVQRSVDADKHLAKAVDAIQDLNETINILHERLRDWYSLHYPELFDKERDAVELIQEYGDRKSIKDFTGDERESLGCDLGDIEEGLLSSLASHICALSEYRRELRTYVEETMEEIAPTITTLTGPRLGGELISHMGSLKKLAMAPSSTIQVLGAEKSLFRHLEKGTPPPKHGYILQHPLVHRSAPDVRGKAARALANKIAIAARIDYFGGDDRGEELKAELERRIRDLN